MVTFIVYDDVTRDRFEIAVTLLDRQRTLDYILANYQWRASDILIDLLGYLPHVGGIISGVFAVCGYADNLVINSIADAGGYTMIENIICTTYPSGVGISAARGWDTYPYYQVPSHAQDSNAIAFDPYE